VLYTAFGPKRDDDDNMRRRGESLNILLLLLLLFSSWSLYNVIIYTSHAVVACV
jgi:hypothetical protein